MYFKASEPISLLNKFQEQLRRNSSELRFLPDDKNDTFEGSAHTVSYSESKLKLRSISDFTSDKFGASIFLQKKIIAATQADQVKDEETVRQLLIYFKGKRIIEYYTLWEKVLTYFILSKNKKGVFQFLGQLDKAISNLQSEDNSIKITELTDSLIEYATTALSMALALEGIPLGKPRTYDNQGEHFKEIIDEIRDFSLAKALRKSNMIRHNYVAHSMINYTKSSTEGAINLIDKNISLL
jgi:hypothetical protein